MTLLVKGNQDYGAPFEADAILRAGRSYTRWACEWTVVQRRSSPVKPAASGMVPHCYGGLVPEHRRYAPAEDTFDEP